MKQISDLNKLSIDAENSKLENNATINAEDVKQEKHELITAALPYVNNAPHLGNIIGCVLSGDIYHRYRKKVTNKNLLFICGTDEHGTATEIEAKKQKITPAELCDKNHDLHKKVYDHLNIEFSNFGRTSTKEHVKNTQQIFLELLENDRIEEREIQQFFCYNCDMFLPDRFVRGDCPSKECLSVDIAGDQCDKCGGLFTTIEILNPKCNECKNTPIIKNTKHLFLKLGEFQNELKNVDKSMYSKIAQDITNQWLERELIPRCITRDLKWGVPIPYFEHSSIKHDDYVNKVFYVWFDAPIGYITFTEQVFNAEPFKNNENKNDWTLTQFMGKDNVSFHSVLFPSMLFGTKTYKQTVKKLSSTEYLLFEGQKFSKSRNHGIFGTDIIESKINVDYWRFYLSKIRPESKDSNFTLDDFQKTVNSFINNFGNLCNRVLSYIKKRSPKLSKERIDKDFIEKVNTLLNEYNRRMDKTEIKRGLEIALELSNLANREVQLAIDSKNKEKMADTFALLYSVIILLGHMFSPFVPNVCSNLFKMIGQDINDENCFKELVVHDNIVVGDVKVLMVHLGEDDLAELKKKFGR